MKCRVELISKNSSRVIEVENNTNLLEILQKNKDEIYAPCGGNGTCSKCKVNIQGSGTFLSCQYQVVHDISVILPEKLEMEVLVSQHENTFILPFIPDNTAILGSYPLGLAIDIGTTTLVFYQVNLITGVLSGIRSAVNHQVKFGGDVISRINYCAENEGGTELLQRSLLVQINEQLQYFAEENGVDPGFFTKIVVAGNNTMLHLLSGINPLPLALAPFTPEFTDHQLLDTGKLGLICHPAAEIHLLPSVSAYVGADVLAGIASLKDELAKPYLYIDIGTNGEMALVAEEKIWCCATAAGPAFEGANISCGSGAVPGAINAYSEGELTTIAHTIPESICGSGLIDIVAYLLEKDEITFDGMLSDEFVVYGDTEKLDSKIISVNQKDIREVQLAKGAIAAGIAILIRKANLDYSDITKLYVAGGFGNFMKMESAMKIGLLPGEMEGKTELIGNAAGSGAMLAIKSSSFIERMTYLRQKTEYIELSYESEFPLEFALRMNFT